VSDTGSDTAANSIAIVTERSASLMKKHYGSFGVIQLILKLCPRPGEYCVNRVSRAAKSGRNDNVNFSKKGDISCKP
jgi:hypothetical protein